MPKLANAILGLTSAIALLGGCGSDEPAQVDSNTGVDDGGSPTALFGSDDDQCPSITLANELTDEAALAAGVDCLFAEFDAGRAVIWDVMTPTVEGDPIYHRFHYDGETVLVVRDDRADTFGSGGVSAQRCDEVTRTNWVPEGSTNCAAVDHPGFPEAG